MKRVTALGAKGLDWGVKLGEAFLSAGNVLLFNLGASYSAGFCLWKLIKLYNYMCIFPQEIILKDNLKASNNLSLIHI